MEKRTVTRAPMLRNCEWIFIVYFALIAAYTPWFHNRRDAGLHPILIFALVVVALTAVACAECYWMPRTFDFARDWLPIYLMLIAFRELNWFTPIQYTGALERSWIRWDYFVLSHWRLTAIVNGAGVLIPSYLELCYVLVYAVGAVCISILYVTHRRARVDSWLVVYLAGTLLAYCLVPFFPSQPPRLLFTDAGSAPMSSALRRFNLYILNSSSIHSGVFPSAHVSSAFSAAWGMLLVLPRRKRYGYCLAVYAASVAIATIYGRYHYAVDTLAGFGISLIAGAIGWFTIGGYWRRTNRSGSCGTRG